MRRWLLWLGVPALLLLGLVLAAVWARSAIAERAVAWQLEQLGIPPTAQGGTALDAGRLVLSDLQFGGEPGNAESADLWVERFEARFGLTTLWTGLATAVELRGVRVRAEWAPEGKLSLGSLDPVLGGGEGEPAPGPLLPARRIRLEEGALHLSTQAGPLVVAVDAEVLESAAGRLQAQGRLAAHHELGRASLEFQVEGDLNAWQAQGMLQPIALPDPLALGPGLRLAIDAAGQGDSLRADLQMEGALRAPSLQVVLSEASAELQRDGERLAATIRVGRVADEADSARFEPWAMSLAATGPPDLAGPLQIRARAEAAHGAVVLSAEGVADPDSGEARLAWSLAPVSLAPDGLQPVALSALLGGWLARVQGVLEAQGTLHAAGGALHVTSDWVARDVSAQTPAARVQGLNGRVQLSGPEPLVTPPDQLISVALLDVGLPLTDGLLRFQLLPSGSVALAEATWKWAGGSLVVNDTQIDPAAPRNAVKLAARDLDLSRILELVDLEGLSGTGRIDGQLPLAQEGDEIRVVKGRLAARGPGRIVYRPDAAVGALASRQGGFEVVLNALDDFSYEELSLDLDGDTQGAMQMLLHLRGRNPNFQSGRLVEFNVNLEAHLADLVRAGLAAYRVPEVIEERIRARQRREAQ